MKIKKAAAGKGDEIHPLNLGLKQSTVDKIDRARKQIPKLSRRKFIEAVLNQALDDPKFVLKLE